MNDELILPLPRDAGEERRRIGAALKVWTGSSVAQYRILEQLGSSGMGLVFRAEDTRLLRTVVLKFLPPSLTRDPVAKERFLKEARAASALDHPNIATVHELGESADGQLFLALAFYDGETVQQKIDRGPLPVDEAVSLAAQIASGLSRAHQRGIIHRDIKPSNLRVTADGIVKILDFGIAKLAGLQGATREGEILGTLAYRSPEQACRREGDPRTDIWSLGAVLYAMLAGHPPFEGDDDRRLVEAILHRQPEPLASVRPEVPAELAELVAKMLAKGPAGRPKSMAAVRAGLGASNLLPKDLPEPVPQRTRRRGWITGTAAALLATGLGAYALRPSPDQELRRLTPEGSRHHPAIAVLPFENLSRNPAEDYMAEGLTESLTTDLAKIRGFKVVSRTSAELYKASSKPLSEIAQELGVDDVLEGSVLRVGDRVRISAKLIEAQGDRSLWAESYDRELRDILTVQSEVSEAIARETRVQLTPEDRARLARSSRTVDPEVYEAYLRGRYQWNRRSQEGLDKAISYFNQALAKDPTYAPAYAGLADAYDSLSYLKVSPEGVAKARAAALEALALDDELPEAHTSLANVRFDYEWDFPGAEQEFRRALEISPNYATAHHWYWAELVILGRLPEAQREIELARELDPLSLIIQGAYAEQLLETGRREAWEAEVKKILDKDPNFHPVRWALAQTEAAEDRLDEACREYEKVLALKDLKEVARAMERTRVEKGAKAAFETGARSFAAQAPNLPVLPTEVAWMFALAGQNDQAFAWLEESYRERTPALLWLGVSAEWKTLRADPRYRDLLRRVGVPPRPEP